MKKVILKPTSLVCLFALLLTVTSTMAGKRFINGWYKQSNLGSTCFGATPIPEVCTTTVTGIICTTPFGGATRTWYQNIGCPTPFYKNP